MENVRTIDIHSYIHRTVNSFKKLSKKNSKTSAYAIVDGVLSPFEPCGLGTLGHFDEFYRSMASINTNRIFYMPTLKRLVFYISFKKFKHLSSYVVDYGTYGHC